MDSVIQAVPFIVVGCVVNHAWGTACGLFCFLTGLLEGPLLRSPQSL